MTFLWFSKVLKHLLKILLFFNIYKLKAQIMDTTLFKSNSIQSKGSNSSSKRKVRVSCLFFVYGIFKIKVLKLKAFLFVY